ncbi:hypothetical protein [Variovorax sp. EL159]|uniref:hypothetical protein n=1 Tax=Variovorax sp. EL159 TaxID=1566270 RepID=UPI00115F8145|nr:hypothetical protein [Variovorax sp. EL159]
MNRIRRVVFNRVHTWMRCRLSPEGLGGKRSSGRKGWGKNAAPAVSSWWVLIPEFRDFNGVFLSVSFARSTGS